MLGHIPKAILGCVYHRFWKQVGRRLYKFGLSRRFTTKQRGWYMLNAEGITVLQVLIQSTRDDWIYSPILGNKLLGL